MHCFCRIQCPTNCMDLPVEAEKCDPPKHTGTLSPFHLLNGGNTTLSTATVTDFHTLLQEFKPLKPMVAQMVLPLLGQTFKSLKEPKCNKMSVFCRAP